MGASSELHIALMEAEQNKEQMDKVVQELSEVNLADYDKKLKDTRAEAKEAKKPQIKNIQGRPLILKGVVEKITTTKTTYGWNSRVEMGGVTYFYSSKVEFGVDKMFKVGSVAAFTVESKMYKEKEILCINQVFYTL